MVEFNIDEICISLEGNKEVHDKIRGKGAFDKVIEVLNEINRYENRKTKITFWCSITEYSVNRLEETIKIAHKYNASVVYLQNVFFSRVPEIDVQTLNEKMGYIKDYAKKNKIDVIFYHCYDMKNLLMWYSNKPFIGRCGAIRTMRIKPDGEVMHCRFKSRSFGNIKNKSFRDIWFSKEYKKFRKSISGTVSDCGRCCDLEEINLNIGIYVYRIIIHK